jgi:hypothetical protein
MSGIPIYFQFTDRRAAFQAFDTLQELEYKVDWFTHDHSEHLPTLRLDVEQCDLASALEITQAHGGVLVELNEGHKELDVYTSAYGIDSIAIPAHIITEDVNEDVLDGDKMDPSADGYDHFPAGIRF